MISKRHIIFHVIPAITIITIVVIAFSGIDSGGDLPGFLTLIVVLLSVAFWSLLFAIAMLVYAVRNKCWKFLSLAIILLVARVLFFSEIAWGNSEDHLYLWLPVEYILFYLAMVKGRKLSKLSFIVITAVLYGLCCLACATSFRLL